MKTNTMLRSALQRIAGWRHAAATARLRQRRGAARQGAA